MTHRRLCALPEPERSVTGLSDGRRIRIDRCPSCGAVAIHTTDTEENR